jgi:transposase
MGYIQGESRNQTYLLPPAIDDYVPEDHPIRFLDAFVDSLNPSGAGSSI